MPTIYINRESPRQNPAATYNPNSRNASSSFSNIRSASHESWRPHSYSKWERYHSQLVGRIDTNFEAGNFEDACRSLQHVPALCPELRSFVFTQAANAHVMTVIQWGLNVVSACAQQLQCRTHWRIAHIISKEDTTASRQIRDIWAEPMFNGRCVLTIKILWLEDAKRMLLERDYDGFWNKMALGYCSMSHDYTLSSPSYVTRETGETTTTRRASSRRVTGARRSETPRSRGRESSADRPQTPLARHYAEHDLGEHVSKEDIMAFLRTNDIPGDVCDKLWENLIADIIGDQVPGASSEGE